MLLIRETVQASVGFFRTLVAELKENLQQSDFCLIYYIIQFLSLILK